MTVLPINIYIKACSRPAYLDRCIASIKRNMTGYGQIIILNDGITERLMDCLRDRHPEVVVLDSPRVTRHSPDGNVGGVFDPARFWVDSISRDPNSHVLVLEEDTWFTEPINLPLLVRNVVTNNVLMLRFFWHGNAAMSCQDEIYVSVVLDGHTELEFYAPQVRSKLGLFKIFYIAHGIYHTDYWLNSYRGISCWADENYVLEQAMAFVQQGTQDGRDFRFAKLKREVIRHSISSTSRADGGGVGIKRQIDNKLYNDIMNTYWYHGQLDPMNNYPLDFSEGYLLSIFGRELEPEQVAAWIGWKNNYVGMYRDMGFFLE